MIGFLAARSASSVRAPRFSETRRESARLPPFSLIDLLRLKCQRAAGEFSHRFDFIPRDAVFAEKDLVVHVSRRSPKRTLTINSNRGRRSAFVKFDVSFEKKFTPTHGTLRRVDEYGVRLRALKEKLACRVVACRQNRGKLKRVRLRQGYGAYTVRYSPPLGHQIRLIFGRSRDGRSGDIGGTSAEPCGKGTVGGFLARDAKLCDQISTLVWVRSA